MLRVFFFLLLFSLLLSLPPMLWRQRSSWKSTGCSKSAAGLRRGGGGDKGEGDGIIAFPIHIIQ